MIGIPCQCNEVHWHVFVIYLPICNRLSWCWHPFVALIMTISIQLKIQKKYVNMYILWVVTLNKTISINVQGAVSSAVLFFRKPISVGQSTYKVGKGGPFLKSVYIRKLIYCFSELKLNFCASHVTSSYVVLHHV